MAARTTDKSVGSFSDIVEAAESEKAAFSALQSAHREDAMTKCLTLCAALVLSLAAVVGAQDDKERFRLQFEISKNGTVVADPILRLQAGNAGKIVLNDGLTFTVTPSRIDTDTIRITCNVEIDNARPQLRFDLRGQEQGSGSIIFGSDSYEIKVAVTR
jgi:hypothetical protein